MDELWTSDTPLFVYGEIASSALVAAWLSGRGNCWKSRSASKPARPATLEPSLKPEPAYTQLLLLVTTYGTVLFQPLPVCEVNWTPISDCSGRFTGVRRHWLVVSA